ncbi:hypothetical protein CHRYSEOSP005_01130 [Chryseobacterium sp. Alg-005]|uniref:T9SS type A sorting domain-containing protein n=1 Tax=Chryseobacterium sp. Alg-005 TaxID=3159516 RepID=UPI003555A856
MKSKNLLFILFSPFLFSQSFNYERSWGTYFGGNTTWIKTIYEKSSSDLFVDAVSSYPTSTAQVPESYYNQFVLSSSHFFTPGTLFSENNFGGNFSATGSLLMAEYTPYKNSYSNKSFPAFRDVSGNRYDIESNLIQFPALPNGTWNSTQITSDDSILSKYDSAGNLVWKTYVPENSDSKFFIKTDASGNIYIAGTTKWQNLGDPGTYEPAFTLVPSTNGSPTSNSYLVKLNSQGQKIWATYIPTKTIADIDLFGNNVYIAAGDDVNSSTAALSTAGTFQQAKAINSIIKINGNSGERIWGTYYGSPTNLSHGTIRNIKVTSTGIYILGTTTTPGSYYGEEGAFKASTTEGWDLFITKFDDLGARDWTTYLGTSGIEMILESSHNIDVKDDKIIVSGSTFGNQNIATHGTFQDVKPSSSNILDIFFSMFNTSGSHLFTSYYGGPISVSSTNANYLPVINCQFSANSNAFYLYGTTSSPTGYATANAHQQNIILPSGTAEGSIGYIAKFSPVSLSVSDIHLSESLQLFNNPNNGSFTIKGKILETDAHLITITDTTGRLIYSKKIEKKPEEAFDLTDKLVNGNYILSVSTINKNVLKSFKLNIKK